jgi:hypothetical protein
LVAAHQGVDPHGAGKLRVEVPREGQNHDKGVYPRRGAIGQGIAADLGPVALRLG